MIIKKIGKKASVSSTLTWVYAIFIIIFILAVFLLFAFASTAKRAISNLFDSDKISNNRAGVSATETLIGFSNNQMIFDSLDVYFDTKHISGVTLVDYLGDINNLDEQYLQIKGGKDIIQNDQKLVDQARDIFDPICKKYMIKVPQGVITEAKGTSFGSVSIYRDAFDMRGQIAIEKYKAWSPPVILRIPYRGQVVELKLRVLKECA
ncbi:MAG: hypothetical protein ABH840_01020 [Nanoarchaeota archaeon]